MRPVTIPEETIEADSGPAPSLHWIDIDKLVVDERYQRVITPRGRKNIQAIAENFRWSHFSPVLCMPVEGGQYAIIDGQHRVHAAALCGIKVVPCMISFIDFSEAASSFKAVNANITRTNSAIIARAASAAGEKWIVELQHIAEHGGCKICFSAPLKNRKPGEIYAINSFRALVTDHNHDVITKALQRLINSRSFGSDKELWNSTNLIPVVRAIIKYPKVLNNATDFSAFIDSFNIHDLLGDFNDENKRRLSMGDSSISRKDYIYNNLCEAIEEAYSVESE